jgi:hypothetical protein
MKTALRWHWLFSAGLGLVVLTTAGCQTWVPEAGLTLPSGHYLKHPPQYIPPSSDFPLSRELAHQEEDAFGGPEGPPPGGGPGGPPPGGGPGGPPPGGGGP